MYRTASVLIASVFALHCAQDEGPDAPQGPGPTDAGPAFTDAGSAVSDSGILCTPNCEMRICGDDGCGDSCGMCSTNESCTDEGQCEPTCVPDCANRTCGSDRCGGSCGSCDTSQMCLRGQCVSVTACTDDDSAYVPPGYACIWHNEFGGPRGRGQGRSRIDARSWTFQNLDVNGEAQNYTNRECVDPEHRLDWNYCIENGTLTLRARDDGIDCQDGADADNQPDNPDCALDWDQVRGATGYTSGRIITKHKVAHQYGYIEFRARLPHWNRTPQSGFWPAIWLLGHNISEGPPPGDTPWPGCGEIDIMEWRSPGNHMGWNALWLGDDQTLDACSAFPEGGATPCGPCNGGSCRGVRQNGLRWQWDGWFDFPHDIFHTYGFLWTRDTMDIFIDGDKVSTFRPGPSESEFQQEMFIIMNLAIGGTLGGAIQITDWETATLEVDYIRWYQVD